MAETAEYGRKRKRRKKKRKQKPGAPGATPPSSPPTATPAPPAGPTQYKHILSYEDPGDGFVRENVEYHLTPQDPAEIPPRPLPTPQNPAAPVSGRPFGVYSGPFGRLQAKRLLDRAGFGPWPGQAVPFSELGLEAAVHSAHPPVGDSPAATGRLRETTMGTRSTPPTSGATTTSGGSTAWSDRTSSSSSEWRWSSTTGSRRRSPGSTAGSR